MSLNGFTSAAENLAQSDRRLVVMGPTGSGKTTFSVSASQHASETIGEVKELCADVAVLSGDSEGILGAVDAGLTPGLVADMTQCDTWASYKAQLAKLILELKPQVTQKIISTCIIDLALPERLIIAQVKPTQIADWIAVKNEGSILYRAFGVLKGCTIIANCQIKSAVGAVETAVATAASEARAVGGERNTFAADVVKGVLSPWVDNASFVFAREVRRIAKKDARGLPIKGQLERKFFTHTSSNGRFEAKSRAHTLLAATEPGSRSLKSLLEAVYES